MNKTVTALLVKFIMTLVIAGIALVFIDNNAWTWALWVAIIGTAVNYLVGDLVVLPKYGNIVASIGDGVMAALVAYIIDLISPVFQTSFTALALLAVLVAVGEYFFHQYLLREEKVEP
ncbi:DUF2512 family protein [Desulfallas thermosapovorans]|uniref:Uncharacterized protein DUF2512 n=1 Tax=Desulfallas thermosapovorans DSM 6562 TaxID=1121431 RepID=A0A5S4ZYA5_9FIRM|nr:DUF2512 family protein [Desulfallas thermosapovorans]TYO98061.1 uncharacterized protein DUF2512 [Desulfallas thermosapovorans DSM 6562]